MIRITKSLLLGLVIAISLQGAYAAEGKKGITSNEIDTILGDGYRADKVPAGDAGRLYQPNNAAALDPITPSSYSSQFKIGANLRAGLNNSCGDMNFYTNIKAEAEQLKNKLQDTIKGAQATIMASASGAVSSFFQYALMKINPTLGELVTKHLDEYRELFALKLKQCQDYERDVKQGRNPLGEIGEIAIGEQWKMTIGKVAAGEQSLEQAEEKMRQEAFKNGVPMADGKSYGGRDQDPINITKSLLKAGMNLTLSRGDKSLWDSDFSTGDEDIKNNPILGEFKNAQELYDFIEEIYGAREIRLGKDLSDDNVKTISGRGYEHRYVHYRQDYYRGLRDYVTGKMEREAFEKKYRQIIPPIEMDELRAAPPYERAVAMEARAQQYAVNKMRNNLYFAKQALKTGIYAPDLQQSGMKGPSEAEFKTLYYRMQDDIREIGQRVWQY